MAEANGEYKDTTQIMALGDDEQRKAYLRKHCGMSGAFIIGRLALTNEGSRLADVRDPNGRPLEYPTLSPTLAMTS
jgi:hypothetical protein